MNPDVYMSLSGQEYYKESIDTIDSILEDRQEILTRDEYEIRELKKKVEKLEALVNKLVAILPPEQKLAFELVEVEKPQEE